MVGLVEALLKKEKVSAVSSSLWVRHATNTCSRENHLNVDASLELSDSRE